MAVFEGFTAADFAVFNEDRWSSHAYNRQRLEVKLKLGALGRAVMEKIGPAAALDSGLTDERPSVFNNHQVRNLRWFAMRSAEERQRLERHFAPSSNPVMSAIGTADHLRHAHLAVQIDAAGLLCGIFLPAEADIDRRNALTLMADSKAAGPFFESLQALPAQMVFYTAGNGRPLVELTSDDLREALGKTGQELVLARGLESSAACLAGSSLEEVLPDLLLQLLPIFRLLCWSQENDLVGLARREKKQKMEAVRELKTGERVRITKGLAAGKTGVIAELDRRGGVKVRLGNILLSLQVDEIERHEN